MPDTPTQRSASLDNLDQVIDALELPDLERTFLRSRWLSAVEWQDQRAKRFQSLHYVFRLTAIVGGVIVPALVGLNLTDEQWRERLHWLTFGLSLLVAISIAVEGFFRFGDRWRHYRRNAELLKGEGWMFFQKSGRYRQYTTHREAYPEFAEQIETVFRQDVEQYVAEIAQERRDGEVPQRDSS